MAKNEKNKRDNIPDPLRDLFEHLSEAMKNQLQANASYVVKVSAPEPFVDAQIAEKTAEITIETFGGVQKEDITVEQSDDNIEITIDADHPPFVFKLPFEPMHFTSMMINGIYSLHVE